jgi:hypothetical protein
MVIDAKRAQSPALQVLVVATAGATLAFLVANSSLAVAGAFVVALLSLLLFLRYPQQGLLVVLLVRASSDLTVTLGRTAGSGLLTTGSSNIALIALVVVIGGVVVLARKAPLLSLPAGRVFALLLVIGLVTTYRSDSKILSLSEWVPVLAGFVVYSLAAYLFQSPRAMQSVLDTIAASFVAPAAFGFYQLVRHEGTIVPGLAQPRVLGTFVHPNPFGFYLVIVLAVFMIQFLTHQGRRKTFALLGIGAASVLLFATYARVAWAGAFIVAVVIAFFRQRTLLIIVPIVVILGLAFAPSFGERLSDPLGGSFADRFQNLWPATIRAWATETAAEPTALLVLVSRLTGLGPGMGAILSERGGYFRTTVAHNDYLRVLVEYGVFGLVMFVLILATLVTFAYRTWRVARSADSTLASVALTFLAVSLAFPLMSLTDNVFGYTANQVYFWALAGLAVGVNRLVSRAAARGKTHAA